MATKLEMRSLNGGDLFPFLAIIGKLDIKEQLVGVFGGSNVTPEEAEAYSKSIEGKSEEEAKQIREEFNARKGNAIGAELLMTLMANLDSVKIDLANFLGNLVGLKAQEVLDLPLDEFASLIVDFKNKPELNNFFKSISSLM